MTAAPPPPLAGLGCLGAYGSSDSDSDGGGEAGAGTSGGGSSSTTSRVRRASVTWADQEHAEGRGCLEQVVSGPMPRGAGRWQRR
jgi:hypothetical protein